MVKRSFKSFKEARKFAHKMNFKTQREWYSYARSSKRPSNIPFSPQKMYKDKGWVSWYDWLGTTKVKPNKNKFETNKKALKTFEEAREFVHDLNLNNYREWVDYRKSRPKDIPYNPERVYKDKGWVSWKDWLGKVKKRGNKKRFKSFDEARDFAHRLKLNNQKEWNNYCKSGKRPSDIPSSPYTVYKDKGWVSWGDWLGTDNKQGGNKKALKTFEEARGFVHKLNLKNTVEWKDYRKSRPKDIPYEPDRVYKNKGWISWGDWLGKVKKQDNKKRFKSFEEAREFVHKLNLKNTREWNDYRKSRPKDIPYNPDRFYKGKGWISWKDWLGTDKKYINESDIKNNKNIEDVIYTLNSRVSDSIVMLIFPNSNKIENMARMSSKKTKQPSKSLFGKIKEFLFD